MEIASWSLEGPKSSSALYTIAEIERLLTDSIGSGVLNEKMVLSLDTTVNHCGYTPFFCIIKYRLQTLAYIYRSSKCRTWDPIVGVIGIESFFLG